MATVSTDRAHRAAKRYIYAWGGGAAEGDATMRDLLGGKGAGLAEMTTAGLPVPPGFTITTEACNDYFAAGEKLPDGLWDDVLEALRTVEQQSGKGFGDPAEPAPRVGPVGGQVLDAGDDGHGPQPRAQRGDPARARHADRQRAVRLGRLPALHPDVRADRHGRPRRAVRRGPGRGEGTRAARSRTPISTRPTSERSPTTTRPSSARSPAATSRKTRTSSWTSRSRRSSRRGSASAPTTTASTTRSPTTSARPSTS